MADCSCCLSVKAALNVLPNYIWLPDIFAWLCVASLHFLLYCIWLTICGCSHFFAWLYLSAWLRDMCFMTVCDHGVNFNAASHVIIDSMRSMTWIAWLLASAFHVLHNWVWLHDMCGCMMCVAWRMVQLCRESPIAHLSSMALSIKRIMQFYIVFFWYFFLPDPEKIIFLKGPSNEILIYFLTYSIWIGLYTWMWTASNLIIFQRLPWFYNKHGFLRAVHEKPFRKG